ncbi:hypothetical protein PENSTE_c044G02264 [Penicillium steckii]|uniref:Uncharacterized protein n=1 Tax=Penicillium steckii TaxID=303698 RepID=A0A1V6SIH0_9EURO|nr:hypothetical protein PENSTE_c044G02264 [Penicillium steckii]
MCIGVADLYAWPARMPTT